MKTKDLLFYIFIAITYIKLDYLFLESETSMQNEECIEMKLGVTFLMRL